MSGTTANATPSTSTSTPSPSPSSSYDDNFESVRNRLKTRKDLLRKLSAPPPSISGPDSSLPPDSQLHPPFASGALSATSTSIDHTPSESSGAYTLNTRSSGDTTRSLGRRLPAVTAAVPGSSTSTSRSTRIGEGVVAVDAEAAAAAQYASNYHLVAASIEATKAARRGSGPSSSSSSSAPSTGVVANTTRSNPYSTVTGTPGFPSRHPRPPLPDWQNPPQLQLQHQQYISQPHPPAYNGQFSGPSELPSSLPLPPTFPASSGDDIRHTGRHLPRLPQAAPTTTATPPLPPPTYPFPLHNPSAAPASPAPRESDSTGLALALAWIH
ncbi:hypothetical protein EKO27_g12046, partial [Xylaria grammica]